MTDLNMITGADLSLTRRRFLKGAAAVGVVSAFPTIMARSAFADGPLTLANSIRSLSDPYLAIWNKGAAAFAKSVRANYVTVITEGNSQKGFDDIRMILASDALEAADQHWPGIEAGDDEGEAHGRYLFHICPAPYRESGGWIIGERLAE